jgi:ubiquinone/menaquinone biosynthesis C-methylase UbiE
MTTVVSSVSEGHRFFAFVYDRVAPVADRRGTDARRAALLSRASGSVVEIGAGTGLNLRHYPDSVTEVIATEPDPHMLRRLQREAPAARVPVRLRRAPAETLPVEDASADVVVSSLVLCSVPDPATALAEARRVLRPGGRLLFLEHVRAAPGSSLERWQDRLRGLWRVVAGGCSPNRDTVAAIEAAGFDVEILDRWDEPGAGLARPHVTGSAVRVAGPVLASTP